MSIELEGFERTEDEIAQDVIRDERERRDSRAVIRVVPRIARFMREHVVYASPERAAKDLQRLLEEARRLKTADSCKQGGASNKG